jgi:hypothetical protein
MAAGEMENPVTRERFTIRRSGPEALVLEVHALLRHPRGCRSPGHEAGRVGSGFPADSPKHCHLVGLAERSGLGAPPRA